MHETADLAANLCPVADFLDGVSISITPDAAAAIPDLGEHLRPGTTVFIGLLPGEDYRDVVKTAARFHDQGFRVVPHFTARNIANRLVFEDYLSSVCGAAAVDEVLVLAGDMAEPTGEFHCSMQLLESGLFDEYEIRRIGVAGHPEGTPDICQQELNKALAQKNAFARQSDADMYLLTQFCFDAAAIISWEEKINAAGNQLPICAGVAGPMALGALLKIATKCKIGQSMRMLGRLTGGIAKSKTLQTSDRVLKDLAEYRARTPETKIQRAHVFTFGNLAMAAKWINSLSGALEGS